MTNVVPYCVRQNRALVEQVLQLGQGVGTQSPKEKAGRRPGPKVPHSPVTTARPRQGPRLQLAKCWGLRARRGRSWFPGSHQRPSLREDPAAETETHRGLLGRHLETGATAADRDSSSRYLLPRSRAASEIYERPSSKCHRDGTGKDAPFYEVLHQVN